MKPHIRGSSKDQLTLPQRGFFFSRDYFLIILEHFLCLFVFILLKAFFGPAEHIFIEISFFWERKRGKGNLDFWLWGCVVLFFSLSVSSCLKNNNMVEKKQEKVLFILLTITAHHLHRSSSK